MSVNSPAKARSLGSAKEGVGHWWHQRLTAVAMVPLVLWFVISLICHLGDSHAEMVAWLSRPMVALMMILTVATTFLHIDQGVRVVIEDYVHHKGAKLASLIALRLACVFFGTGGVLAVILIAAGG